MTKWLPTPRWVPLIPGILSTAKGLGQTMAATSSLCLHLLGMYALFLSTSKKPKIELEITHIKEGMIALCRGVIMIMFPVGNLYARYLLKHPYPTNLAQISKEVTHLDLRSCDLSQINLAELPKTVTHVHMGRARFNPKNLKNLPKNIKHIELTEEDVKNGIFARGTSQNHTKDRDSWMSFSAGRKTHKDLSPKIER